MVDERMHLSWNKFAETTVATFRNLGSTGDFSDVTLVGEDCREVKAHRVILASCSSVLRKILLERSDKRPFLTMKGMQIEDVRRLLTFMYTGEVVIERENLKNFLKTTNELKIAGLTKLTSQENSDKNESRQGLCWSNPEHIEGLDEEKKESSNEENSGEDTEEESLKSSQTKSDIEKTNYIVCSDQGCQKIFSSRVNLNNHQLAIHGRVIYPCTQCSFKSNSSTNLKTHTKRKHFNTSMKFEQGVDEKFNEVQVSDLLFHSIIEEENKDNKCDRCGIANKSGKALMKHRQMEHPGKNFFCNDCNKEFVSNNNLKIHKKSIHQLMKYPCNFCSNQFTCKTNLQAHKKKQHNN